MPAFMPKLLCGSLRRDPGGDILPPVVALLGLDRRHFARHHGHIGEILQQDGQLDDLGLQAQQAGVGPQYGQLGARTTALNRLAARSSSTTRVGKPAKWSTSSVWV